jgi:hypothetical protein
MALKAVPHEAQENQRGRNNFIVKYRVRIVARDSHFRGQGRSPWPAENRRYCDAKIDNKKCGGTVQS